MAHRLAVRLASHAEFIRVEIWICGIQNRREIRRQGLTIRATDVRVANRVTD
jgi:hypothetical protein